MTTTTTMSLGRLEIFRRMRALNKRRRSTRNSGDSLIAAGVDVNAIDMPKKRNPSSLRKT